MSEKESHDAMREAVAEVIDHPERTPPHEDALKRYLSGVAYQEKRQEERERRQPAETTQPTETTESDEDTS